MLPQPRCGVQTLGILESLNISLCSKMLWGTKGQGVSLSREWSSYPSLYLGGQVPMDPLPLWSVINDTYRGLGCLD